MEERFALLTEYWDPTAQITRQYQLLYYVKDNTLEMIDIKNRRTFLKRCACPAVQPKDLFVGSIITVYARQLTIIDYGDEYTRAKLGSKLQRTLALIKPDAYLHMGKIIQSLTDNGLKLASAKMVRFSPSDAQEFYAEHRDKPWFGQLVTFMSGDVIVAMELVGDDAIAKWRTLIGPTDVARAKKEAPKSLRALYGTGENANACHGSDSQKSAERELQFIFGRKWPQTATFNNCTIGVIKPHAISQAGSIIDAILDDGFEISGLQLFQLDRGAAEEFLEVYKGVVPEYHGLVEELCTGACVVMEIRAEDAVNAFRRLTGPSDPAIAQHIAPNSLRARFGQDKVKNAIHCTDLPEDGVLESEYFFAVLQQ
eukprot:TRINITY_DN15033_c0_g1_i1.p1 TRINITY_DN15033_c0_g1~~TRINITY_DN15033_c0_g1_i1.p1  ORF type:complete len:369 (-),score=76.64 TRINITY_DN15033_c0_g1_i1:1018-2124(-)